MSTSAAPSITDPSLRAAMRRAFPSDAQLIPFRAADGWELRTIRWPYPDGLCRGDILFVGGRGDHMEKYLETFEDWRLRGWRVESFDWRGQGGSGRLADDPMVGHANDFDHWVEDLAYYVDQWKRRTAGPHVIIGHSMGGHILLRALADGQVTADAAILVAPMLGFTAPFPDRLGLLVAKFMTMIGKPERAAWGASEKPGSPLRLRQKLLTHDNERYDDELWWKSSHPEIALGPASWRWVEQAYASFVHLAKPGLIEAIRTPVLILAAAADGLVSVKAIKQTAARLMNVSLHVYGSEAAHELLREADVVRDDALARIDDFLAQVTRSK